MFEVVKDWPGTEPAVFAIGAVAVIGMVLALGCSRSARGAVRSAAAP